MIKNILIGLLLSASVIAQAQAPVITQQPASQEVCTGKSVSFVTNATGTPTPTVSWWVSHSGTGGPFVVHSPAITTKTFTFVTGAGDANALEAIYTNSGGSATAGPATLTLDTAVAVGTNPLNQTVASGSTATFTVAATSASTAPITYQWQVSTNSGSSWANVSTGSGGTTTSYTTPATTTAMSGYEYRANLQNTCSLSGGVNSKAATLTVTSSAPSYALAFSTAANRSSAAALQGATLSGNVYVFTSPYGATTYSPTGIQYVCYSLDGIQVGCDYYTPFDYVNTTSAITWITGCAHLGTATASSGCAITASGTGIIVSVLSTNPATITGVADTLSNSFTALPACAGSAYSVRTYYAEGITLGADTVTATASASEPYLGISVQNYSGITGPPSVDTNACGTGTSANITAGPINTLYGKELIVEGAKCYSTCSVSSPYTARTGAGPLLPYGDQVITTNGSYSGAVAQTDAAYVMQIAGFPATTLVAPWVTSKASNSSHTISQVVTKTSGGTETDTATFIVSNNTAHFANLSWNTVGTITYPPAYYMVGRSQTSGGGTNGYPVIGTTATGVTTYSDTTVSPGTYYYVVKAVDTKGSSSALWSNQATAVIP